MRLRPSLTHSGIDDAIPLGYNNVAFPFLILMIGLVAALGQLATETIGVAIRKVQNSRKRTQDEGWIS